MAAAMSTMRWELSAATLELPAVVGVATSGAHVEPFGVPSADAANDPVTGVLLRLARRARLPRPTAVLAPTLPALMLLGLCIAGLSDPPDQPRHGSGAVSRLHVLTQEPDGSAEPAPGADAGAGRTPAPLRRTVRP
jgi:hypothetical protein